MPSKQFSEQVNDMNTAKKVEENNKMRQVEPEEIKEYMLKMENVVIPKIVAKIARRQQLAAEMRHKIIK